MTLAVKTDADGLSSAEWNAIQTEINNRTKAAQSVGNAGTFTTEATLMSVVLDVQSGAAVSHVSLKTTRTVTVILKVDGVAQVTRTSQGAGSFAGSVPTTPADPAAHTHASSTGAPTSESGRVAFSFLTSALSAGNHTFAVTVSASNSADVTEGDIVVHACTA